jgi:streptogramin lyase
MPQTFLKRITANGEVTSFDLPPGSEPVGPVAAVGGAVWVPVRDGVLQSDAASGKFVRHVDLAPASTRAVALVGKGAYAYVTDGGAIRRLDPQRGLADSVQFGPDVIGLASFNFDGRVLLRNETGGTDHARVASALSGDPLTITAELPVGFEADSLVASATRIWATGTVNGAPAIALLDTSGVRATIVLQNGRDVSLAWTSPNTVTVVSNGQRSEIRIP